MRKSISIITATAMVAAPIVTMASPLTVQMNAEIQQHTPQQEEHMSQEEQQRHRQVKSGKGTKGSSSSSSSSHDGYGVGPPGWNSNGWHDNGGWFNPGWSSSSSSSGKSGKSGGGKSGKSGSGKSGKSGGSGSSSSSDDSHGKWAAPPGWWGPSSSSSSSGKSGKSGGGKSGKSGGSKSGKSGGGSSSSSSYDGWHGNGNGQWDPIPGWWAKPDSSSSSSSGKSGKSGGSKGGKGSKNGSSSSSSSHGGWYGPGDWGNNNGWNTHGDWGHDDWEGSGDHSHGHWHFTPKPWKPSSSSSSHSKSGKTKSSKGASSSSSSSSSSPDGYHHYHVHEHEHSSSSSSSSSTKITEKSFKPDSTSLGICAPHFDHGGLDCSIDRDFSYCTGLGSNAECGSGHSCYDKQLCPKFNNKPPTGVCDTHGSGLECDHVTTYCSEPGGNGECGAGRKCHDAGLCGFGSSTSHYEGVCGLALHDGKHSGLDCKEVSTMCTEPGEFAECAHGAKCFNEGLCHGGDGHAGFCSSEDGFDCDETSMTHCARPGEGGQCPHGKKCFDIGVCAPTLPPLPPVKEETPVPTPSPTVLALKEFCFHEGQVVECASYSWGGDSWGADGHGDGHGYDKDEDDDKDKDDDDWGGDSWGADGHGDGHGDDNDQYDDKDKDDDDNNDGHKGDAISVPFMYTVDTNGKIKPEEALKSLENAILDNVAEYIEDNEEYEHFSGRITAALADELADDEYCGDGNAIRCSVVKGEMSVYIGSPAWDGDGRAPEGWAGDGHSEFDQCVALHIIKESMKGNDYSEVEGVTGAVYRDSELKCEREMIIGGANLVIPPQEDDQLSAGAAFGLLAAAAALLALAFIVARKLRRQQPVEVMKDDISLISNSLNGSLYDDQEDPYANTIDVHKCTSIYCNCNGSGGDTTFLPAPKRVDMTKTMMANGVSPTAVDQANEDGFFNQGQKEVERQASNESQGSIMRVPILSQYEQNEGRPLTPVNEVAHDSEIDTELESLADGDNDETTIPPPPPLAFHPAYRQDTDDVHLTESTDEISI